VTRKGHIEGTANSQVILVVEGGRLTGSTVLPEAAYPLRITSDGVHVTYEVGRSACLAPAEPVGDGPSAAVTPSTASACRWARMPLLRQPLTAVA